MLALAALAGTAGATPARVNSLDGGNFLVPDDWDVVNYYSLLPEFTNHLYFYYPLDRRPYGWGMYDAGGAGSFIIWINRGPGTAAIFGAAGSLSSLGFSNEELGDTEPGEGPWDPKDGRIAVPDVRFSVGWGRRFGDGLSLGLCTQLAGTEESDRGSTAGTGTVLGALSDPSLAARYALFTSSVTGFEQHQRSSSFVLGPSVSLRGESFTVDAYAAYIRLGVDNSWNVTLQPDPGAGFDRGAVTRTLEFDGSASWQARGRFMMPLTDETTLAVHATYTSLDLSTTRRVSGSFSGAGLTAPQAAGLDHTEAVETLTAAPWAGVAGLVTRRHDYVVVLGIGANGSAITVDDRTRSPRAGGATLNDTVESGRSTTTVDNLNLPLILGVEYAATRWLKLRAVGQRNILGTQTTKTDTASDANADGTPDVTTASTTETAGIRDWIFRLGVGVANDRIGWDVLFNLAPTDADYASPFFTAPAHATFRHPSFTTAIVYKW